ncbi:hypothetical protein BCR33DRAFT_763220 [Rhizoclosmatium globosum]|uniref:RING-type domain-containing protein n=1 Tax=Rhizoclosmatium globosum TaxID=329046 RepID=A0A1Y2CR00_9FUNG|nr:hypothetical protein BCR33DRAFT_763220 [Rhizoclosmatium globosum]|eukprot:ORY49442.1 hypothetical protein BCR33DRAFT_763220 [Rhizoclosmatium globosum]
MALPPTSTSSTSSAPPQAQLVSQFQQLLPEYVTTLSESSVDDWALLDNIRQQLSEDDAPLFELLSDVTNFRSAEVRVEVAMDDERRRIDVALFANENAVFQLGAALRQTLNQNSQTEENEEVGGNAASLLAACSPVVSLTEQETMFVDNLKPALLPYQKRALKWMLHREQSPETDTPLLIETLTTVNGSRLFFNRMTEMASFSSNTSILKSDNVNDICGGILADEMGLGKTVEILALICAHPGSSTSIPPIDTNQIFKPPTKVELDASSTIYTCSSCPVSEKKGVTIQCFLCSYRYHLNCVKCIPSKPPRKNPPPYRCSTCISKTPESLLPTTATLIITPPSILSQWISEIHTHAPTLSVYHYLGRKKQDYSTPHELSSYDIVITTYDVLQKEFPFVNAEDNPRYTRHDREYEPAKCPLTTVNWWRVCLDEAQMVESVTTHTAAMARRIPRIHPWVVTGTPISKHGVSDLYGLGVFLGVECTYGKGINWFLKPERFRDLKELTRRIMCRNTKASVKDELVLPAQRQWIVELEFSRVERSYYDELYRLCLQEVTHQDPETGYSLRRNKKKKSEDEGKIKMRQWLLQLRQICCHPQIGQHNKKALGAGGAAEIKTIHQVLQVMKRQAISAVNISERHLLQLKFTKAHLIEFKKDYERAIGIYRAALIEIRNHINNATAALSRLEEVTNRDEDDGSESGEADMSISDKRKDLVLQLHLYRDLQHQAVFFTACCYNSLGNEELENKWYKDAELLRREMLGSLESDVEKLRSAFFKEGWENRGADEVIKNVELWRRDFAKVVGGDIGLVVRRAVSDARVLLSTLSRQWEEGIASWRSKILELINTGLEGNEIAEGEKLTGEEYAAGEERQSEMDDLMDHYREMLEDRWELLDVKHVAEGGTVVQRKKHTGSIITKKDRECEALREKFFTKEGWCPLAETGYMPEIERRIARTYVSELEKGVKLELECVKALKKEFKNLKDLANARIEFFKRFQEISHSLDPMEKPVDVDHEMDVIQSEIGKTEVQLVAQIGRSRYLNSLSSEGDDHSEAEKEKTQECPICKEPIDKGFITECGHFYHEECMNLWIPQHRKCAVCKQSITNLKTQLTKIDSAVTTGLPPAPQSDEPSEPVIYRHEPLDTSLHSRITSLKLDSRDSFGTKADFLLRHLLHIFTTEPTAKCILFSQWEQVLSVIGTGCDKNSIGYVKMDTGGNKKKVDAVTKFRIDPNIKLFMLNSKSQSSGLTLVNATHVFLVEPVVNPGVEMQAINRVHRIGQTKETNVYRYIIQNTIEGRVYTLLNRDTQALTEVKKETKDMGGGEYVVDDDVAWCLLGKRGNDSAEKIEEIEEPEAVDEIAVELEQEEVLAVEVEQENAVDFAGAPQETDEMVGILQTEDERLDPVPKSQFDVVAATEHFVRKELANADAAHDFAHIQRVRATAVHLASVSGADALIVELASLLHDIGDYKLTKIDRNQAEIEALIAAFFKTTNCPAETVLRVASVASRVGFKKNAFANAEEREKYNQEMSIELACVQDADTLDAMGAIGIARAFAFGGSRDRPLYDTESLSPTGCFSNTSRELTEQEYSRKDTGSTVGHFFEKLLKLKDRLLTEEGKRMGIKRHEIMIDYLRELGAECVGMDNSSNTSETK